MRPIIPAVRPFDQSTLEQIRNADPIVQRYRARFALFDWSAIDPPRKRGPGNPGHPKSAYLKAALVRSNEHLLTTPRWRAYLLDHPLLVLELGFRPHLDLRQPYGFDVAKTVPSIRHLNNILRSLDPRLLANLFEQSVHALQQEIPGLGEAVAYDVKHIYANVKENNFRAYVEERFKKDQQPTGDRDCRLGVKKSTNQEQPDGSTKEKKELLWGYGSGVAAATDPVYGDVVLAEFTQPFNENDVTYFVALSTPGTLTRPVHLAEGLPPFRSISMLIPSLYAMPMAPHVVPSACACIPPISSGIPMATEHSATAVPCSIQPPRARPVTMSSFANTKAVSRISTSKQVG
jgi:hypothetical protein